LNLSLLVGIRGNTAKPRWFKDALSQRYWARFSSWREFRQGPANSQTRELLMSWRRSSRTSYWRMKSGQADVSG